MARQLTSDTRELEDALHQIRSRPDERREVFRALPFEERAEVLLRLRAHLIHELLSGLSDEEAVETLEHLDPDEIADVLQGIGPHRRKRLIASLSDRFKKDVQVLSSFDPKTAAGLMNLDYIQVDENESVSDVSKKFRVHEKRTGRLPAIIAMRRGKLSGYLPGHELGFAKPSDTIKPFVRRLPSIDHRATEEDVIALFRSHPHNKVVVLGDAANVMGIIYSDDILRVLEEQQSASLYDFAGVHDEESVTDPARVKIRSRYKWLIINLATAFLASFTVGLFGATIAKYVLLAVYMPIVAGMGGNAATQTLAVMVRGIALKQIEFKTAWPALRAELAAGFVNGIINGVIVAGVVLLVNHDVAIALILGTAMISNLLVAGFFGTLVPLVMAKFGKDPATSATIFITTATDVLGFLAFLGLASVFLH